MAHSKRNYFILLRKQQCKTCSIARFWAEFDAICVCMYNSKSILMVHQLTARAALRPLRPPLTQTDDEAVVSETRKLLAARCHPQPISVKKEKIHDKTRTNLRRWHCVSLNFNHCKYLHLELLKFIETIAMIRQKVCVEKRSYNKPYAKHQRIAKK